MRTWEMRKGTYIAEHLMCSLSIMHLAVMAMLLSPAGA